MNYYLDQFFWAILVLVIRTNGSHMVGLYGQVIQYPGQLVPGPLVPIPVNSYPKGKSTGMLTCKSTCTQPSTWQWYRYDITAVQLQLGMTWLRYDLTWVRHDLYSTWVGFFTNVCLFFPMISQKLIQLGSPNMTYKCSTMNPGNSFILGQKVKGQCLCQSSDWTHYRCCCCICKLCWVFP